MPYCPNCGNLIKEGDQFCSKCGKSTKTQKQEIKINITREKSLYGAFNPFKVCYNGSEIGSVANGETKTFSGIDNQKFLLKVYPWGDSIQFHKVACEVEIDPSQCRTNVVNCKVVTEMKVLGFIAPLFSAAAKMKIYVSYQ